MHPPSSNQPLMHYPRNKYGNHKQKYDNIIFDSGKEVGRYMELKLMENAGYISNLLLQQRFELLPAFRHNGEAHRKIEYIADFTYTLKDGKKIVEDVKSPITRINPVYRIKKKLLLFKYKDFTFLET